MHSHEPGGGLPPSPSRPTATHMHVMYLSSAAPLCKSPSAQHATSPRHGRTKFGRWEFYVACPTAWNSLPDYLCDPSLSENTFRRSL